LDRKKLASLKAKYDGEGAGKIHDPRFARVADKVFTKEGTRPPPYSGIPTFLYAPYREINREHPDFSGLQVAMVGVPMDLGVTNRPGARFGPRALRAIERVGPYNHFLDCAPVQELKVADTGDMPLRSRFSLDTCMEDIEAWFSHIVEQGVVPLAVGGDHSITQAILKAVGRNEPVGLIHIDAHCDTSGPYDQSKFHHGGPFRNAVLDGVLDPERTIQIGIRGSSEWLWEFSYESGMTVIHAEEMVDMGIPSVIERARKVVGDGPVYISFDIDSVDPAFAPGTGTPEIGGPSTREIQALLRGLKGLNICGGDVVEVAPQYDSNTNTAHAAAQVLFEILSLMAFSPFLGETR